jgi:hypothetical protein
MRYLRSHAIALVALFIALGGSAYAVSSLPANSVDTRQLRDGAVTDAKVRAHSLTGRVLKAGLGKARYHVRSAVAQCGVDENPCNSARAVASCLPGERAAGGGVALGATGPSGPTPEPNTVTESAPVPNDNGAQPRGWVGAFKGSLDPNSAGTTYAICASR